MKEPPVRVLAVLLEASILPLKMLVDDVLFRGESSLKNHPVEYIKEERQIIQVKVDKVMVSSQINQLISQVRLLQRLFS